MEYKISEITEINKNSLGKNHKRLIINYLDTANLTEGKVEEVIKLDVEKDEIPSRARRIVKENDILISTVRPNQKHYGIVGAKESEYIVSTGFAVLTPNTDLVNPYFLYKYLTLDYVTETLQTIAENSTSAYPSIRPSVIGDLKIKLPKISVQKKIGEFLRNIDQKLQSNYEIITTLEQLAQTLFKRWFVDFEFPNENGDPYKSSGGEMVESELGMIPVKWHAGSLTDIATLVMGQSPKGNTYNEEKIGVPLINGASDFKKDHINPLKYTTDPKRTSQTGDFLFGVRATVGNVTYVDKEYALGRGVGIARPKKESFQELLYFLLIDGIEYLKSTATGSVYINFTKNDLERMKFVIPDIKTINLFHEKVKSFMAEKYLLLNQNESLIVLRDTLLPKLLSGEMELPDETEVTEDVPIS